VQGYETHVIEAIIEKLTNIFAVQPDSSSSSSFGVGGSSHGAKGLAMLAGSKSTEIRTNDSVVSIEVVERPRMPSVCLADLAPLDDGTVVAIDPERDDGFFKELSSVDAILASPVAAAHFRLYLQHAFLLENLTFVTEVDRFKAIMRTHASRLWSGFIATKAASQINIPANIRSEIFAALESQTPSTASFDRAQQECMNLLKSHYRMFLNSRFAQGYAKAKLRQRGRRGLSAQPKSGATAAATANANTKRRTGSGGGIKIFPSASPVSHPVGSSSSTTPPSASGLASPSATGSGGGGGGDNSNGGHTTTTTMHTSGGARLLDVPGSASHRTTGSPALLGLSTSTGGGLSARRYIPGQTEAEMAPLGLGGNPRFGNNNLGGGGGGSGNTTARQSHAPSLPGTAEEGGGGVRTTGVGGGGNGSPVFDELDLEARNLTRPGWESEALVNPVAFHQQVGSSASLHAAEKQHAKQPSSQQQLPLTPTSAASFAGQQQQHPSKPAASSSSASGTPAILLSRIVITDADQSGAHGAAGRVGSASFSQSPTTAEPSNVALVQNTPPVFSPSSSGVSSPGLTPRPSARASKAAAAAPVMSSEEAESLGAELTVDEFRLMYPTQPVPEAARRNTAKLEAADRAKKMTTMATRSSSSTLSPTRLGVPPSPSSAANSTATTAAAAGNGTPRPRAPTPQPPQLSASELEAESLRFMIPGGTKAGAAGGGGGRTGDRDLDDEIDRLVNPGAEVAKLLSPGSGKNKTGAGTTTAAAAAANKRTALSPAASSATAGTTSPAAAAAATRGRPRVTAAAGASMLSSSNSPARSSPPTTASASSTPAKRGMGRAAGAAIMANAGKD
jgi:hypothetical protein